MIRTAALRRLAFVAALAGAIVPGPARAQELAEQASVIDGDTLEIHGARIRLWGIDAPEHDQLCRGDDSLPYRCGAAAANKLGAFIAQRPVYCAPKDIDRYGRTVASCRADAEDLGEWLVSEGLALDWPRYSKGRYSAAQREAESAGRGMWAGSYVEPWQYRGCVRAGGRPAECSDDANSHP
jgi:endonuclease YncB( thermonuclease family)